MKSEPLDPRSTGRRRGRKVLENIERPYWCRSTDDGGVNNQTIKLPPSKVDPTGAVVSVGCGRSPSDPNAPGGMYPGMSQLQVNHINKDILDNDPVNLEWACVRCHKYLDSQTKKGVSIKGDEYGYTIPGLDM